jgi:hypothetical protein
MSFLGRMPEEAVRVHGVLVAPPGPGPDDVPGRLQVGHDGLNRAFGQPGGGGDIAGPGLRITGDLDQHVPVPGQQRPGTAALITQGSLSEIILS